MAFAQICTGTEDISLSAMWIQTDLVLHAVLIISGLTEYVISKIEAFDHRALTKSLVAAASSAASYGSTEPEQTPSVENKAENQVAEDDMPDKGNSDLESAAKQETKAKDAA